MPSDYEQIRLENEKEYGRSTKLFELIRDLYSDRTHFILELLQNAEDAHATFVEFIVQPERLIVQHDGRPFTTDDVRGICGVGVGTKHDDLTAIGRFGIGFKSVFGYSDRPEVYSGDEHFAIERFVRPIKIDPISLQRRLTRFEIPFNRSEMVTEDAAEEIRQGLLRLDSKVLLFLRHVRELRIATGEHDTARRLSRVCDPHRPAKTSLADHSGADSTSSDWLLFQREVQSAEAQGLKVEVAFKLEEGGISRVPRSPLVVFFPTEKDTRLHFLIQGPYQTTPARDNIPNTNGWNKHLVRETATLVGDSLRQLVDLGLLDVKGLAVLPLVEDDFLEDEMLRPIFDEVKIRFLNEALFPIQGGGHAPSPAVLLGRSEAIRSLLSRDQLSALFDVESPCWADGQVTEAAHPELWRYMRLQLEIDEITPQILTQRLSRSFLEAQSDGWITNLYSFLGQQPAMIRRRIFDDKPIIRMRNGRHVAPFSEEGRPNAYLPVGRETEFPTVRRSIVDDPEAREFLEDLGLSEPDRVDEVLDYILPLYRTEVRRKKIDEPTNDRHIRLILDVLGNGSRSQRARLSEALDSIPILRAERWNTNRIEYAPGDCLYHHTPELDILFAGNPDTLWLDYSYGLSVEESSLLNAASEPRITVRSPNSQGHVVLRSHWGYHERGLDGFDPDAEIDGLSFVLDHITADRSEVLWNLLADRPHVVEGTIEKATRQDYTNSETMTAVSRCGKLLREREWLPSNDEFLMPSEVSVDDLPTGFKRSRELGEALGMRSTLVDTLAKERGISPDDLQWILDHPDVVESLRRKAEEPPPEKTRTADHSPGRPHHGEQRPTSPSSAIDESNGSGEQSPEHQRDQASGRDQVQPGTHRSGIGDRPGTGNRNARGGSPGGEEEEPDQTKPPSGRPRETPRVTYVQATDTHSVEMEEDHHRSEHRRRIAAAGVEHVVQSEEANGRSVTEMPPNHPGYDLESVASDGTTRYIEVKALSTGWGRYGVSLTTTEFRTARNLDSDYWLYVVQDLESSSPSIARIRNPAGLVNQYVFDSGWLHLVEDEPDHR